MLSLCGCRTPPTGAPTDIGEGFRRENHPAFTPEEQAAARAAHSYLERTYGKKFDAYYRVKHTDNGWDVVAFEVYGYKGKQPRFRIASDYMLSLTEDGVVKTSFQGH